MSKNIYFYPHCSLKNRLKLKSYKFIVHTIVFTGNSEKLGVGLLYLNKNMFQTDHVDALTYVFIN